MSVRRKENYINYLGDGLRFPFLLVASCWLVSGLYCFLFLFLFRFYMLGSPADRCCLSPKCVV